MRYNFHKRLRKYRITRNEFNALNQIIRWIKGKTDRLFLYSTDYQFLKDIGQAKEIRYLEQLFNEWSCDCYSCTDRKRLNAKKEVKRDE